MGQELARRPNLSHTSSRTSTQILPTPSLFSCSLSSYSILCGLKLLLLCVWEVFSPAQTGRSLKAQACAVSCPPVHPTPIPVPQHVPSLLLPSPFFRGSLSTPCHADTCLELEPSLQVQVLQGAFMWMLCLFSLKRQGAFEGKTCRLGPISISCGSALPAPA